MSTWSQNRRHAPERRPAPSVARELLAAFPSDAYERTNAFDQPLVESRQQNDETARWLAQEKVVDMERRACEALEQELAQALYLAEQDERD